MLRVFTAAILALVVGMLILDSTRESLLLSVGLAVVVVGIGLIRYRGRLAPVGPHAHTEAEDLAEALEEDAEVHGHGA